MIGIYIKELRLLRGLSQEELSQSIGLSTRQLIRIEHGQFNIKVAHLLRAIAVLNAPLSHIQTIIDNPSITADVIQKMTQDWVDQSNITTEELMGWIKSDAKAQRALLLFKQLEELAPNKLDHFIRYGKSLLNQES